MQGTKDEMENQYSIEAYSGPPRRTELVWLLLYPFMWAALSFGSNLYWFLPAGLRIGTLWLLPRTMWRQMALLEFGTLLVLNFAGRKFDSTAGLVLASVLPWCLYALAVRVIGRHGRGTRSREALARLLVCGMAGAILTAIALTMVDLHDKGVLPTGLPAMLVSFALGDMAGVIILMPILLALRDQFGREPRPWPEFFAYGLVLAPLAVAIVMGNLPMVEAPVYPLVLAFFPLFAVTYRFGWRQCAIATGLLGSGAYFLPVILDVWGPGQLQLLMAAAGCAALLLGVVRENQRVQGDALRATVQTLSMRGTQLVEAANRIASLQEQERRRIGAELHDQIGQDMTAIATRLRVVERTSAERGVREGLASIGLLVADAHSHLREVINHLHPAVLDRFGLSRALAEGPIAEMLHDHNVDYIAMIEGEVDALPDNVASALYRICQEAATNAAKHGCGGRMHINLTLVDGAHGSVLRMDIEDNAGALQVDALRPGRGLQNIRDRAHAIGATYLFDPLDGQPRHSVRLWMPK